MTLLRAMPEILDKNPGAKLIIVGRGHIEKEVTQGSAKNEDSKCNPYNQQYVF